MKKRNASIGIGTRSLRLRLDAGGRPASLDESTRSVEIVVATETDKVMVYDWELGRVPEILLMSGFRAAGQVPLLDTHSRYGVSNVLGSVRDLRIEDNELIGSACYSSVQEAESAFTKTKEGHLTDYSAGYRHISTTAIVEGETVAIDGRAFTGPCLVVTEWELKEVSTCPIGADNKAKARSLDTINPEDIEMNEFLRKMRVKLGLAEDATEDQIRAAIEAAAERAEAVKKAPSTQQAVAEPGPAGPGAEEARRQAVAEERARTAEITALCEAHNCRELAVELTKGDTTVAEAQRKVLDHLKSRASASAPGFDVTVITDERDKFRAAADDGLSIRLGLKVEKPSPGALALAGYTLRELCREALVRANQPVPAHPLEMVGRALTTSDLPNVLGNVANKSLLAGFGSQPETYEAFCDTGGSLADFKTADLVRRGELSDLEEVREDGEFKYGKTADTKEQVRLLTYGKIIPISRQAILNDDLGVLTSVPFDMGEAVQRCLGDLAYAVLTANANMADGVALFHSTHANLAGSGAAVDVTPLNAGVKAMGLHKDLLGKRRLNIRPTFFVGPRSIEGAAEQFFKTDKIGGVSNKPNLANIYFGDYFTRVYDARLDDDSLTAWYLLGPKGKTVKMFFLNGQKTPFMEQRFGFEVDGIELKVRIDAAAKAQDYRPFYKNPGA